MDYKPVLNAIEQKYRNADFGGTLPDYIPELANISPDKFGMHLYCIDGSNFSFGDSEELFSVQSISKVFTLTLARMHSGAKLWKRVNVEPSGNPFNSLTELERDDGIPRNPFINSGALVVADVLLSHTDNPKQELLDFVRHITGDNSISYDENIAESEKNNAFRNIALVNYMKALGNIHNDPDDILDFYYHQCSLAMSCHQLAKAFMVYANEGIVLETKEHLLVTNEVKRTNALMQTCGFYDEAGEFTYRVGLPGKSGVGGGIAAVRPGKYSVAVWSPLLNKKGNSKKGMRALEALTLMTNSSIF